MFDELLKLAKSLRGDKQLLSEELFEAKKAFELENVELLGKIAFNSSSLGTVESNIRVRALGCFSQDKDVKSFASGIVKIRVLTKLVYDDSAAYLWACKHGLGLKLDKVNFEKVARIQPDKVKDFVEFRIVPSAVIAKEIKLGE